MESLFLPIDSKSLAHYFGCACIRPAKYFDNKPKDIQDKYSDFLLLTNKEVGTQETDCCLEVFLYPQEKEKLHPISGSWFLCNSFLPISRVLKIYFSSEKQKGQTLTNIEMSTAFIPKQMVGETMPFSPEGTSHLPDPDTVNAEALDLTKQIRQYDRFLGALALMRVAREDYMNVSENFIDTLSFFNTEIEAQLRAVKEKICDKYIGLFSGKSGYAKIKPYLDRVIMEQDVEEIAASENQSIRKNPYTRVIELSKLKGMTYVIAFLYTFGVGPESHRKKIDGIIGCNFHNEEIEAKRAEGVAMSYGYNRGYSVFTNYYQSQSGKVDVKFRMEDKLDLYLIESVFNNITNPYADPIGKIEYIDKLLPENKVGKLSKNEYVILGTKIIGKKKAKVFSPEYWEAFFAEFDWGVLEPFKKFLEKIDRQDILETFVKKVAEVVRRDAVEEEKEMHSLQIREMEGLFQKEKTELMCSIEALRKEKEKQNALMETSKEQSEEKKEPKVKKKMKKIKTENVKEEKDEGLQEGTEEAKTEEHEETPEEVKEEKHEKKPEESAREQELF